MIPFHTHAIVPSMTLAGCYEEFLLHAEGFDHQVNTIALHYSILSHCLIDFTTTLPSGTSAEFCNPTKSTQSVVELFSSHESFD